jgi:hypothetical protein
MVVLHEVSRDSQLGEGPLVPAFEEEAALVTEDAGLQQQDIRDGGGERPFIPAPRGSAVSAGTGRTGSWPAARPVVANCASSIHFWRQATSSGQATLRPWRFLDDFDELPGLEQGFMGAGVEPGHAASHDLDLEMAAGRGRSG